ncbi:MAG: hypothetical protein HZB85_04495 [Deltaproteobacteria bacterium]|nr:hypothetical protein [Deltaproteobacteria bacterium]
MKTGILITARLGSTRLGRKHLLPVNGVPVITYLAGRLIREFEVEIRSGLVVPVIATSDEPENRAFETLATGGLSVFYGSLNNIPLRHLQAAKALSFDNIVAVDGDDILCSVEGMRAVYEALKNKAQYVSTIGLPFGMNSFGYARRFLEASLDGRGGDILETGWGRIFDAAVLKTIAMPLVADDPALRFTLDYDDDYMFFKAVIEALAERVYEATVVEIVECVRRGGLTRLNARVSEEYWANFRKNVDKEDKAHGA